MWLVEAEERRTVENAATTESWSSSFSFSWVLICCCFCLVVCGLEQTLPRWDTRNKTGHFFQFLFLPLPLPSRARFDSTSLCPISSNTQRRASQEKRKRKYLEKNVNIPQALLLILRVPALFLSSDAVRGPRAFSRGFTLCVSRWLLRGVSCFDSYFRMGVMKDGVCVSFFSSVWDTT